MRIYFLYDFRSSFVNSSTIVPSSFISTSPSVSTRMKALGVSTVTMSLPSVVYMVQGRNSTSMDTSEGLVSYLFMYA